MKKKLYLSFFVLAVVLSAPLWLSYVTPIDQMLLEEVITYRSPALTTYFRTITSLGNTGFVFLVLLLSTIFLYKKGKHRESKIIIASSVLGIGAAFLVKDFVMRPRPYAGFSLVSEGSYSFPSAHATIAITLYFLLFWNASLLVQRKALRIVLRVLSVVIPLSIVLSRVYLGVHFPSDLIGGALLGVIAILFCRSSFRRNL